VYFLSIWHKDSKANNINSSIDWKDAAGTSKEPMCLFILHGYPLLACSIKVENICAGTVGNKITAAQKGSILINIFNTSIE
jgi:hypothetical protein